MELGNIMFGNSRGLFEVDRSLQNLFCDFLDNSKVFCTRGYCNIDDYKLTRTNQDIANFFKDIDSLDNNCYCLNDNCKSHEEVKKRNMSLDEHGLAKLHHANIPPLNNCANEILTDEEMKNRYIQMYGFIPDHIEKIVCKNDNFFEVSNQILFDVVDDEIKCKTCGLKYSIAELQQDAINKHLIEIVGIQKEYDKVKHLEPFFKNENGVDFFENDIFMLRGYVYDEECNCGVDDLDNSDDCHKESCALIKPHFYYKPTDLKIMWYKYPFRDSYSNRMFDVKEFKDILKDCMKSLNNDSSN
jgi:hypothetical protein